MPRIEATDDVYYFGQADNLCGIKVDVPALNPTVSSRRLYLATTKHERPQGMPMIVMYISRPANTQQDPAEDEPEKVANRIISSLLGCTPCA